MSNLKILFITLSKIDDIQDCGIYTDLLRIFISKGHQLFIVCPSERRFGNNTEMITGDGYSIVKVKILNIQKTNIIEKGIGTILLEYQYYKAIKHYFYNISFDLLLYTTPPITLTSIIKKIKNDFHAKTYLLLKDIFPQNAIDIGMMSSNSLLYKFFRKKEKCLYELSDFIGCMSPANIKYIVDHNPELNTKCIEVCPNSIELRNYSYSETEKIKIKRKYNIPLESLCYIYGGNLGKPQGLDFLLKILDSNKHNTNYYFIIIGSGTEFKKISKWFQSNTPKNAILINSLPKNEYDTILKYCDVGLIFLDKRFTIPNYPSRLLSYLEHKIPILMATDINSDIGKISEEQGYGLWTENGDLKKFNYYIEKLSENPDLRLKMGEKGYNFLRENYTVEHSYNIIIKHFI